MTIVDLNDEADAEARRLAHARRFMHPDAARAAGGPDSSGPWIAMARRRRRLRHCLGRRVCLVWRVALENAAGQVVESRLMAVFASLPPHRVDRAWIREILEHTDGAVRRRIDAESEAWRTEAARVAAAFTDARLTREREVAGVRLAATPVSQPGLFDRRADRARAAGAAASAEAARAAAERLRTITDNRLVSAVPARLLLVLVP
jgi:hypothetical protein